VCAMKTVAITLILLMSVASVAETKTVFKSVVVKDGQSSDLIYNYLDPDGAGKDVWTMVCVKQPCYLFHKGDRVTFTMSDKLQRVRVGKLKTEKGQVGLICGAPTGCFNAAVKSMLLVDQDITERRKDAGSLTPRSPSWPLRPSMRPVAARGRDAVIHRALKCPDVVIRRSGRS
jgi:hypothetical protein